jgi:hypothetical protein
MNAVKKKKKKKKKKTSTIRGTDQNARTRPGAADSGRCGLQQIQDK